MRIPVAGSAVRTGLALLLLAAGTTACGSKAGAPGAVEQPPAAAAPRQARSFTVVASGDVLLHNTIYEQARKGSGYDFRRVFAGAAGVVGDADLAVCHVESPFGAPGGPFSNYPNFSAPPQVADTLKAIGYDTCSVSSNHVLDTGVKGVVRTLDKLDAVGIRHAGAARSAAEAKRVNLLEVRGAKVAQLSYSYGFNGKLRPKDKPWLANLIDAAAIRAEAKRARDAGAEVVIASLHWGQEYRHKPLPEQSGLAAQLLADPNVDLIIGHHAHVVQPFAKVNGKWVAYGLGNQIADQFKLNKPVTQQNVYARFTFTDPGTGRWAVTKAEFIPMVIDRGPYRVVNLGRAVKDSGRSATQLRKYRRDLEAVRQAVLSLGADRDGLVVGD